MMVDQETRPGNQVQASCECPLGTKSTSKVTCRAPTQVWDTQTEQNTKSSSKRN